MLPQHRHTEWTNKMLVISGRSIFSRLVMRRETIFPQNHKSPASRRRGKCEEREKPSRAAHARLARRASFSFTDAQKFQNSKSRNPKNRRAYLGTNLSLRWWVLGRQPALPRTPCTPRSSRLLLRCSGSPVARPGPKRHTSRGPRREKTDTQKGF